MDAHGHVLRPIMFPKPEIDTTDGSKVQRSRKGLLVAPGDDSSASDTDSDRDEGNEDVHKPRQLEHAARLGQPITIVLKEQYQVGDRPEKVGLQSELTGEPAPQHILEPLQWIVKGPEQLVVHYESS
jgi:hypothetical protein